MRRIHSRRVVPHPPQEAPRVDGRNERHVQFGQQRADFSHDQATDHLRTDFQPGRLVSSLPPQHQHSDALATLRSRPANSREEHRQDRIRVGGPSAHESQCVERHLREGIGQHRQVFAQLTWGGGSVPPSLLARRGPFADLGVARIVGRRKPAVFLSDGSGCQEEKEPEGACEADHSNDSLTETIRASASSRS